MTKNYICAQCGNEFWPYSNKAQRFCSKSCGTKFHTSTQKLRKLEKAVAKLAAKIDSQPPVATSDAALPRG